MPLPTASFNVNVNDAPLPFVNVKGTSAKINVAPKKTKEDSGDLRYASRSSRSSSQMLDMQRSLRDRVLNPETNDRDAAACATAFVRLEERRRLNHMAPDPSPVDVLKFLGRQQAIRVIEAPREEPTPPPVVVGQPPSE
jgi:hypothetical protein